MKQIVHLLLAASFLLIASPGTGWAADSDEVGGDNPNGGDDTPGSLDQGFVRNAAQGLIFDVIAANFALTHSFSPSVRKLARIEVRDHSKDYGRLTNIATRAKIPIPTAPNNADLDTLQDLSKLFGSAFDQAYLQALIKRHFQDVSRYSNEARFGANPNLRVFANDRVGSLLFHIQLAFAAAQRSGVIVQ